MSLHACCYRALQYFLVELDNHEQIDRQAGCHCCTMQALAQLTALSSIRRKLPFWL